jgi:hypothetical protein
VSEAQAPEILAVKPQVVEGVGRILEAEGAWEREISLRKAVERERDVATLRAAEAGRRTALARREIAEQRARAEEAEAIISHARAELAAAVRERDAVLRSTSWKITAPLRAAGSHLPAGLKGAFQGSIGLARWILGGRLPGGRKPNG